MLCGQCVVLNRLLLSGRTSLYFNIRMIRLNNAQNAMDLIQIPLFLCPLSTPHGSNVCMWLDQSTGDPILLPHTRSTWPVGTQYAAALHWTSYDCFVWDIYQAVASALITLAVDAILILRGTPISRPTLSDL